MEGPKLDPSHLPNGVIFDERHRDQLLNTLAARGRVVNARDAIPPPPPPPPPPAVTLLYPFLLLAFPNWSYGLQGRGDCMAWSACHNVDVLMAVNIELMNLPEKWVALSAIEAQYGFMRVEALGKSENRGGDGGSPTAAAQSVLDFGTLHRLAYDLAEIPTAIYDFREYDESGDRSGYYGRYGIPDELEPTALEHRCQEVAMVTDFETAVEVLKSGVPISNADPRNPIWTHRDSEGFGDRRWDASHAMNYIGYRLGSRPGLLKINTGHGFHVDGPMYPDDCPGPIAACAAWEDAETCDKVLKAEWSWAYSEYIGFPKRDLATYRITATAVHPEL